MIRQLFFTITAYSLISLPVQAWPWSQDKYWPTSWDQFERPINEKIKKYVIVRFTSSLKEACEKYQIAESIEKIYYQKKLDAEKAFKAKTIEASGGDHHLIYHYSREQRYYGEELFANIVRQKPHLEKEWDKWIEPTHSDWWPYKFKSTAAGYEVLRKAGIIDWKKYARYDRYSIGDLREVASDNRKNWVNGSDNEEQFRIQNEFERYRLDRKIYPELFCKRFESNPK